MGELVDRLRDALADRYALARESGTDGRAAARQVGWAVRAVSQRSYVRSLTAG